MSSTPPLGAVISNRAARRSIYGAYVIALVAAGGTQVAFSAIGAGQPDWLTATLAVLAYLGIPVGSLAFANAKNPS